MKFTGFLEVVRPRGGNASISCSIRYFTIDDLFERMRDRLAGVPPGAHVRIDLIAWGDLDESTAYVTTESDADIGEIMGDDRAGPVRAAVIALKIAHRDGTDVAAAIAVLDALTQVEPQ
jgi:hypothetical protein